MHITVRIKYQYGRPYYYPVDEGAILFATIAGTQTLPSDVIEMIKKLGYEVRVQQDQPATL